MEIEWDEHFWRVHSNVGATAMKLPTFFIPHGGGPCFFMEWTRGPADTWERLAQWLRDFNGALPAQPRALLVVSAHWEEARPTVMTGARPPLLFDYHGFPPHTYQLKWPAPGAPELADQVIGLLGGAGIPADKNPQRGFDHGVFVPLLLCYPDARVPTLQLSLRADLEPEAHLAIGRALMASPKLLILDEPSIGLAPMLVAEVFRVIRTINEQGVSILLIEQNAIQALQLSSRGYVLEQGHMVQEEEAAELLEDKNIKSAYLGI